MIAETYYSCAQTAELVRLALRRAFPGQNFLVTRKPSSGLTILVSWTDGPTADEVRAVAWNFEGSYTNKGQTFHFGANFILCMREFSDQAIQWAIDCFFEKNRAKFLKNKIAKPTIKQFRAEMLWGVKLNESHICPDQSVQAEISQLLANKSFPEINLSIPNIIALFDI